MVGGVGQRMLTSVSKRMATEFFTGVERQLTGVAEASQTGTPTPAETSQISRAGVFTAPPRAAGGVDQDSFVKGVALGAGLVLLGVVAGGLFGRRRR
jgi:hypothetical protein